jgi:hypothetical protein
MDALMLRFAASISSRSPIKREPHRPARITKCCDERKIDHDSIGLAKAEKMGSPSPPLPVQMHVVPSAAKSHTAPS